MCYINGKIQNYFKLDEETRHRDPIPACLFILVLKIAFPVIKTNQNIKPLNIFSHDFLYNVYADDTTFFIRNKNLVARPSNVFGIVSVTSGLH